VGSPEHEPEVGFLSKSSKDLEDLRDAAYPLGWGRPAAYR